MQKLKRGHKFFMGGFHSGAFVYTAIFLLGMCRRFRMLRGY
ncbi:MAG: hypothetical protein ACERKS_11240 [Candidatus Bathyarchaeota archaeon]